MVRFDRTSAKTERARQLRRDATPQERKLWLKLRGAQLGASFRRQHPIGPYTLDFYAPSIKLAIEVDGGQHARRKTHDDMRTAFLNGKGIRVLRFWNCDVAANLNGVADQIWHEIQQLTPTRSAPRSDLPLFGGGKQNLSDEKLPSPCKGEDSEPCAGAVRKVGV